MRIASASDPLEADRDRVDFVGVEHQRRQVEPRFQNIAHSSFARNWYTLPDEGSYVPINRARLGFELIGDSLSRDRRGLSSQYLNNLEEPVCLTHFQCTQFAVLATTLSAAWQYVERSNQGARR